MANNAGNKNPALTKRGRFNPNVTPGNSSGDVVEQRAKAARDNHTRPVRVFRAGKWRNDAKAV